GPGRRGHLLRCDDPGRRARRVLHRRRRGGLTLMAEQTLASVAGLADWIGDPIPENSADAKRDELCLRAASALVRSEAGRTWLTPDGTLEDVPETVKLVTLYCASRVYDNREGQNRWNIDDAGGGWKVDEAGAYLTASEKDQLSKY